jgi:hypothetical protein
VAPRLWSRVAAAVVLAAAVPAVSLTTAAPAQAAACSTASGVTVVVDFNQLGGGVRVACDGSGGGDSAASLFTSNGFSLTPVARFPSFVCRVNGAPASDPCQNTPPSDAYWSLYWSDGRSGRWSYSSQSAYSLKIPDGGYVAFSWKQGSASAPPSASASPHAPEPSSATQTPATQSPATQSPNSQSPNSQSPNGQSPNGQSPNGQSSNGQSGGGARNGGGGGDGDDTGGAADPAAGGQPSASTSPSASGSASGGGSTRSPGPGKPGRTGHKAEEPKGEQDGKPGAEPAATPTDAADPDVAPTASPPAADDGLPGWVAPGLIAVLFAAAGATVLVRRRGAARQ